MARYRVVVTDQVFPTVDVERAILQEIDAELEIASGGLDVVLETASNADGLLNTYLPLDGSAISRLRRCRVIARYGIGVDNVDLPAARDAGIDVTNVPDYCVEEVAVHALALLLSLVRRLPKADAAVRAGGWEIREVRPVRRLSELTVGLIGYGKIPRRLHEALRALGVTVIAHDPFVKPAEGVPPLVSLEELLANSDVVSVHAPLTADTRGLIGGAQLALMRPDALLVNTSRGGLVRLDDLLEALRAGRIGGAALDVFEEEPPDPKRLREVPNLLVTPHMAFYSEASIQESQRKAATQVAKVLTGKTPDYLVN